MMIERLSLSLYLSLILCFPFTKSFLLPGNENRNKNDLFANVSEKVIETETERERERERQLASNWNQSRTENRIPSSTDRILMIFILHSNIESFSFKYRIVFIQISNRFHSNVVRRIGIENKIMRKNSHEGKKTYHKP